MDERPPEKKEAPPANSGASLLDMDSDPAPSKSYQTSVNQQMEIPQSLYSTSVVQNNNNEGTSINFLSAPVANFKNIVVVYSQVIT